MADDACPACFGHYKKGRRCECQYLKSCICYTYDVLAEKAEQRRWDYFSTVELNEQLGPVTGEEAEDMLAQECYIANDGREYDAADVNLALIEYMVWLALEQPATARALIMKLNPSVHSLQDVADRLGVTRQAVQKRIAGELGMGKRNYKSHDFMTLKMREFEVYKLCVRGKRSMRAAARMIGVSPTTVRRIVRVLREKGFRPQG